MKRVVYGNVYGKKKGAETRKQNGSRRLGRNGRRSTGIEDVVPEVLTDGWNLNAEQVTKIINRKKKKKKKRERTWPPTVLLITVGKRQLFCIKK